MSDPFEKLGLAPGATADEIARARRMLAKRLHPDVGGDAAAMQAINAAATAALRGAGAPATEPGGERTSTSPGGERTSTSPYGDHAHFDAPSFVIEALPAEAFEALIVAAWSIGEVVDDDPPYVLDVRLDEPTPAWCRLQVVPDAGSSTVSLGLAPLDEVEMPAVEVVRDRWIGELNRLDWSQF